MKIVQALYRFFAGDMVILGGVTITVIVLVMISSIPVLAVPKVVTGTFLILAVLTILSVTLRREIG